MKKVLFRSAVSGYNRDDVNEFIAETDARHADEAEAAAKRIAELEAELETNKNIYEMKISGLNELLEKSSAEAKRAALDSEKKLADMQANSARELAGARNDAASARQHSEELKKKLADAEARISRQNDEVKKVREMNGVQKNVGISDDELADLRRRAAAYDKLMAGAGAVPQSGAAAEADNVIRSARAEAASIRREAMQSNSETLEEARRRLDSELAEIYETIRRTANEGIEELLACMRAAEENTGKIGEQLRAQSRDAVSRVENMRSELDASIAKKLESTRPASNADAADDTAKTPAGMSLSAKDEPRPQASTAESRSVRRQGRPANVNGAKTRRDQHGEGLFRFGRRK